MEKNIYTVHCGSICFRQQNSLYCSIFTVKVKHLLYYSNKKLTLKNTITGSIKMLRIVWQIVMKII